MHFFYFGMDLFHFCSCYRIAWNCESEIITWVAEYFWNFFEAVVLDSVHAQIQVFKLWISLQEPNCYIVA